MRVILRGLRKFFFMNTVNNPIYSFKKLHQIMNKLMIKIRFINLHIPSGCDVNINRRFYDINNEEKYHKSFSNLRAMEEDDELSDVDGDEYRNRYDVGETNVNNFNKDNS